MMDEELRQYLDKIRADIMARIDRLQDALPPEREEQRMLRGLIEPLPARLSAIEARFSALEARFGGIEESVNGIALTLRLMAAKIEETAR